MIACRRKGYRSSCALPPWPIFSRYPLAKGSNSNPLFLVRSTLLDLSVLFNRPLLGNRPLLLEQLPFLNGLLLQQPPFLNGLLLFNRVLLLSRPLLLKPRLFLNCSLPFKQSLFHKPSSLFKLPLHISLFPISLSHFLAGWTNLSRSSPELTKHVKIVIIVK
jgi:hypothetical protein